MGGVCATTWEDRSSELADYRIIQGNCNVPKNYSENTKLAYWVAYQRQQYCLHVKGKTSRMTTHRIQALESLGFEWKPSISHRKGPPKKPILDDDHGATYARERAAEAPDNRQLHSHKRIATVDNSAAIKSTSLSNPKNPTGMAKSTSTSSRVKSSKKRNRVEEEMHDLTKRILMARLRS